MQKLIYEPQDLEKLQAEEVRPEEWTAIIPAAGTGSRLGHSSPKILYPVAGRPIVAWMIEALKPCCARFVFILSPAGREKVEPVLRELLPAGGFAIAVQEKPVGMADAIFRAKSEVRTRRSLIVWGDQVTLRTNTIRDCMRIHAGSPGAVATVPTILKRQAYIHFERSDDGRIRRVLQAREGDRLPEVGENDCGVFLFESAALFGGDPGLASTSDGIGKATREANFLPLIAGFDRRPGDVVTARIIEEDETLGVNTPQDAADAARILMSRERGKWERN